METHSGIVGIIVQGIAVMVYCHMSRAWSRLTEPQSLSAPSVSLAFALIVNVPVFV